MTSEVAPPAPPVETVEAQPSRWSRHRVENVIIRNSMVIVLLLVIAYFSYKSLRFASVDNVRTILVAAAPFALVALGQTIVILTGGIDLSVGSIIAVSAMTGASLAVSHPDQVWIAVIGGVLVGALVGLINGLVISYLNVTPFVATLGTLAAGSGVAYVIGGGAPINGLPQSYGLIANTAAFGIQIPVIVMIVGILAFAAMMKWTTFGLRIYAIGGNRNASELAGVKTRRTLTTVYLISGALAGISGIMLSSRVISGPPDLGNGYELDAIAAVVIGGASLFGGRGTIWGTVLGLFLIQTLNNGLDILIVPAYWQDVIRGALIVGAVAVDMWATKRNRS